MDIPQSTPVLDLTFLASLRQLDGPESPGFAAGIVAEFLGGLEPRLAALRAAAAAGALEEFGRQAHNLKSTAAQLGGARIRAACQQLEDQARDGSLSPEASWLPRLLREFEDLRAALRAAGLA